MKRRFLIVAVIINVVAFLRPDTGATAQSFIPLTDARSSAMGLTQSGADDNYAVFHNFSALPFVSKPAITFLSGNSYLLKEITSGGAGFVLPNKNGAFGLCLLYEGFSLFSRKQLSFCYAQKINDNISVGVKADYLQTSISEYGNHGSVTGDFSVSFKTSGKLMFAANVSNPFRVFAGYYADEKIATEMTVGANYLISEKCRLVFEESKLINQPARFHSGIEYFADKRMALRAGFVSNPFQYSFGAGILFGRFQADLSSLYHPLLGYSPSLSLQYAWGKK